MKSADNLFDKHRSYLRAKIYLDRTASVVLGGLGIRLLISR